MDLERDFYTALAKRDELNDPSLTYNQLFDICRDILPGKCPGLPGLMFELFVLRFGQKKDREILLKDPNENRIDVETIKTLMKKYALRFWFETITKLPCANTQVFLFTLSLEYRGLSRLGIQYLAFCGVANNPRTYDRKRDAKIESYDADLKIDIEMGQCIFAWDNFCKQWFTPAIKSGKETSALRANFTVGAVSRAPVPHDMSFVKNRKGDVLPSVPITRAELAYYLPSFLDDLKHALCDVRDQTGSLYSYWSVSEVVKKKINTVPMVDKDEKKLSPSAKEQLHSRGLINFRPMFVSADNPSSNVGCMNALTRMVKESKELLKVVYPIFRVDVDPWMKCLRVACQTFVIYPVRLCWIVQLYSIPL